MSRVGVQQTVLSIPKMDCPSEERLVRMALDKNTLIESISFDLNARTVTLLHSDSVPHLLRLLEPLRFGATEIESHDVQLGIGPSKEVIQAADRAETKVLYWLLGINGSMFFLEIGFGFVAHSTGLIADSLDMLADTFVYGISLYAVGKSLAAKNMAARTSGWMQLLLAGGSLFEVVRRFYVGTKPVSTLMMTISLIALCANVLCLWLISKHRDGGNHMKTSWIFSSNDVMANIGVIISGALVAVTHSAYPDLIIGLLISVVVASGAIRILRLSKNQV